MKVIKKITAMMLSIMMVLGMCSVVGAADGTSGSYGDDDGIIRITSAIEGQTYTIYRMLKLESFSGKNYSYKAEDKWENFVNTAVTSDGKKYFKVDDVNGYVEWNPDVTKDDANKAELAKKALEYAKDSANHVPISTGYTKTAGKTGTVEYTGLPLGYYLVDSSVGALCFLDTTAKEVEIQEKNGVPSVEKKVQEDSTSKWEPSNTADIGQKVNFQTTITAQAGAQNYVLHDVMSEGLTFNNNSVKIVKKAKTGGTESPLTENTEYTLNTSGTESVDPKCTFEVEFKQDFCDTLANDDQIIITYSATLNKNAVVAGVGNTNTTNLEYGDNKKTTDSTTTTYTFEIPVFKYTGTDTPLAGANFTLKKEGSSEAVSLISIETPAGKQGDFYRVAVTGETGNSTVTTGNTGKFTIQGLDADTYYLTETKQPDGYNKLSAPVKIVIAENGTITIGESTSTVNQVEVENKSGSLLPSTGGMGTTLFYIFGAILVIGSGVVLITKKRMK